MSGILIPTNEKATAFNSGRMTKERVGFQMSNQIIPQNDHSSKIPELRNIIPDIQWVNGEPHYPIAAVVSALYQGKSTPNEAWQNIKRKLKRDGSQLVLGVHKLLRQGADGKMRPTDYGGYALCLLVIQYIDGSKAMPFKELQAIITEEYKRSHEWSATMNHVRMTESGLLDEPASSDRWIDIVAGGQ